MTFTPAGWLFDHFVVLGMAWLFAGLLPCGLIGWLMARRGAPAGRAIGTALLLWGTGVLAAAAAMALYVWHDSARVLLKPVRCESSDRPAERGGRVPLHALVFALPGGADGGPREARGAWSEGPCPLSSEPAWLRVRHDALRSPDPLLRTDGDSERDAPIFVGMLALFGSLAALFGWALAAHASSHARAHAQAQSHTSGRPPRGRGTDGPP